MTPGSIIALNGELLSHEDARIPIEERSTIFAEAIYEVIRFYGGRAFRLPVHMERMRRSLDVVGLDFDPENAGVETLSQSLIEQNGTPDAVVYWQVAGGAAPRELAPATDPGVTSFAISYGARPLRREPLPRWKAITTTDQRWHRCDLKTTMLLPNVLALREARRRGCDAAIFCRGNVITEANTANCFAVVDGVLRTHPADQWILNGVTRGALLDCIGELELEFDERALARHELLRAEEVFLCGTTTQLTAITEIDGSRIGAGDPGPISTRLFDALREKIAAECGLSL